MIDAINAISGFETTAEKRAVLKLLDNFDLTSALTFNTGFITLDLNGYMLKHTGTSTVLDIYTGADVILIDSNGADATYNYYVAESGVWVFYEGELPESAPENAVTGTVTGGIITGGNASNGGGVYVSEAAFTMNGGTIAGNAVKSIGGGICLTNNSTFTMNGGMIAGNATTSNGGGVYVSGSTFTMNEGTISSNVAASGGGVYVKGGTFTMEGGTISNNSAVYNDDGGNGGGVLVGGMESAAAMAAACSWMA